jgi:hypothetical protein
MGTCELPSFGKPHDWRGPTAACLELFIQQVRDYNELSCASRAPRIRLMKAPELGLQG